MSLLPLRCYTVLLFAGAASALLATSCGRPGTGSGGSGGGSPSNCTPGAELCSCMTGNACNPGLACADDINKCVVVGTTHGSGGNRASGGTTGAGGFTSAGGATGTGGSFGTGGTTGAGGFTGSGGATGTGGASGPNLVMNGDLSLGDTGWNIGQGSPSSSGVMNGQYCATFNGGTVLIGWGNGSMAAHLMSGATYKLSYQVSSSNGSGTALEIHIGQAVSPYNSDLSNPISGDSLQSSPMTFSHTFVSTATDNTAGIAFLFTGNGNTTVCVDNLTVTAN